MVIAVNSVAAVKATVTSDLAVALDAPGLEGFLFWTAGDFSGQADDVDVIASNFTPLTSGAWVRQSARGVSFQQPGTGSVIRASAEKMGEMASVLDFGAAGDGVTDDTAAFTAAMAAHKAVFVPAGTYVVEYLSIPTGVTLSGAGPASILRLPAASTLRVLVTTGNHDWVVEKLTLDARGTGTSIASFTSCVGGTLRNIWATGSNGHGIEFDNCGACSIDSIELYGTGSPGGSAALYLKNATGGGSFNRVSNIRFRNITGRGLHNLGNNFTQISNLQGDMTNGEILLFQDCSSCTATNVIMAGGQPAEDPHGDGIAIEGNCLYITLDGFSVANSPGHAVSIGNRAGANGARYCTVSNGVIVNANECGVAITDQGLPNPPAGNVISNVVVQNAGRVIANASFCTSGGSDNQFVNCTAVDSQGSPTTTYGYQETDTIIPAQGVNNIASGNCFTGRLIGPFTTAPFTLASTTSAVHETTASATDSWVAFDGATGGVPAILASRNIASVARNSAGNYTLTMQEAVMTNPPVSATTDAGQVRLAGAPTSTSVTIEVTAGGTPVDSDYVSVRIG